MCCGADKSIVYFYIIMTFWNSILASIIIEMFWYWVPQTPPSVWGLGVRNKTSKRPVSSSLKVSLVYYMQSQSIHDINRATQHSTRSIRNLDILDTHS